MTNRGLYVGSLFVPRWKRGLRPDLSHFRTNGEIGLSGWTAHLLEIDSPLSHSDEKHESGKYLYPFLSRAGRRAFLLCGTSSAVAEAVLDQLQMRSAVASPTVNIAGLVETLSEPGAKFALGAVFAHVEGYGQALRTIILYGQDLAQARLFRAILPRTHPYRATIKDPVSKSDLLTVGSRGEIQFSFSTPRDLRQVDRTIFFMREERFISWNDQEQEGPPDDSESSRDKDA